MIKMGSLNLIRKAIKNQMQIKRYRNSAVKRDINEYFEREVLPYGLMHGSMKVR
jgi:hypothetical protein